MSKQRMFRNLALFLLILFFIGIVLQSFKYGNFMIYISSPTSGCPFGYGGLVLTLLNPFLWGGCCLFLKARENEESSFKPSIGVMMFGMYIILTSLNGFVHLFLKLRNWKEAGLPDWGLLNNSLLILPIITLILGINILRLKEWARKGVVIFSSFMMVFVPIMFYLLVFNHKLEGLTLNGAKHFPVSFFIVILTAIIFGIPSIYFFTRFKVKEQFKKGFGDT